MAALGNVPGESRRTNSLHAGLVRLGDGDASHVAIDAKDEGASLRHQAKQAPVGGNVPSRDREGRAHIALAVDSVKDFLQSASVVVCPEHIGIASAGYDTGAFLDPRIAGPDDQPDARRDFLTGRRLDDIARGSRRHQQRSKQESSHLAPGHPCAYLRSANIRY
jgi:hypothetical protein